MAKCNCPPPGAPLWLATFADLMSLLMCFFVLLLSFSEMDVMKYKQIAGSMKYAFGVQNKVEVKDIPKGTSVIALEFRPGRPDPTPIEIINQQTNEMTEPVLDLQAGEDDSSGGTQQQNGSQRGGEASATAQETEDAVKAEAAAAQDKINQQVKKMAQELNQEIADGAIEIESLGQQIIIRIREKGSFASGSGFLQPRFKPVVRSVGELLKDVPGIITVSGYTDDMQISDELYSSNWDLSSKRAVAVADVLLQVKGFDPKRMKVVGMASNNPIVPNDSPDNRARNRRVEIAIEQGKAKESEEIQVDKPN
ncbi:flagellar motor protein MotB [Shewanella oneidensis MR-1]|uniref:Stator-force generator of Na+ coupled flagellar motor PomB n=1 Tax=Shewanella oneidensis (strain ATCC 700550 / JCM 31522 / CIP 106686 / LMG 19005 / NCIMB 14063 / MR-1) TaxID=211586 RepID=Q8EGR5_SHEON|nr:flagellar motor protein MotB [Shewanella oneidensis]AAN54590.1 stator-force generator of Na+ coupled flagellar motor PomB [Shewanella oneidensis MR-1]MDX5996648.1 flagellar motor protein MotB [Shewanella oneidensis]MEE2029240.1 Motility protein B [Shewanella oneidensis]QKG96261.1 flagellar motor protein MotB [Shewanella oneidensis MR-1]